jgi:hypothetical protein
VAVVCGLASALEHFVTCESYVADAECIVISDNENGIFSGLNLPNLKFCHQF